MTHIDDRIASLEAQLAELKAEVGGQADAAPAETSRRDMFKKIAIGVAGVATVGTVLMKTAEPAAAAHQAEDVGLNLSNPSTASTVISHSGSTPGTNIFTAHDGITGSFFPAGIGGYATGNTVQNGVYGYTGAAGGHGVVAYDGSSTASGSFGLRGYSVNNTGALLWGQNGIGAQIQGAKANMILSNFGAAGPARVDAHAKGEIICDGTGEVWFCTVAGTPGTWRKLSGPSTAGQLHLLAAPVRVYDSRSGAGPVLAGTARAIDMTTGFVGTTATPAVPVGASGALFTLTLADTVGGGFVAAYSNAVPTPSSSSANWSATGQFVATTTVSAVDAAAKIAVAAGGSAGAKTNVIIDAIGYYQ